MVGSVLLSAVGLLRTRVVPLWMPVVLLAFLVLDFGPFSTGDAVRHACADTITVQLRGGADAVAIDVVDDGRGCADGAPPGLGLQSMRDRATELGGSCSVTSAPGGGTRVSAVLPLGGEP